MVHSAFFFFLPLTPFALVKQLKRKKFSAERKINERKNPERRCCTVSLDVAICHIRQITGAALDEAALL